MGRRKIEMKLVKNKQVRTVTYSKRRSGIFNKANELSILCGAQVGIFGFSPCGRPFSLGCPNINVVTDKFLNGGHESGESPKNYSIEKLSKQLEDLQGLENENRPAVHGRLNLEELKKLKTSLEELHEEIKSFQMDLEAASSLLLLAEKPVKRVK